MTDLQRVTVTTSKITVINAQTDRWYVCRTDLAPGPMTVILPTNVQVGHSIVVQNAPAGGPGTGQALTVQASGNETIRGLASETLNPPVLATQMAGRTYLPIGPNWQAQGWSGPGWVR